jgi:aromatic-L-amino-acid/L-tryptophan decarboxylase
LDVASGTGRWLQAFLMYVKPQLLNIKISCDLLDPSKHSMPCLLNTIECPLELGRQYEDTVQKADLPKDFYDIIWSMHGFYAIPRYDLGSILKKIYNSLNNKGEAFIAQATRKSFYVQFYDRFLDAFNRREQGFTSAEDITEALNILGLHYQIHTIAYDEYIAMDDLAALEHYILEESVNNSFMGEDVRGQSITSKIKVLLDHSNLGAYLRSFIKKDMYCFPQEIWLISFGKKERYPECSHTHPTKPFLFSDKNKQGNPLLPSEKEMCQLVDTAMKYIVRCQSDTNAFPLNGSGFKWVHSDPSDNYECEKMLSLAKTVEESLPEDGAPDFEEILYHIFHRLAPYSTNDNSGGYLAYIPGGGLFHSALADFISLSLNRYVSMFMAAPGLAAIEGQAVRWLCDITGFPKEAGGVITSGGATATFSAIHTARTKMLSGEKSNHFLKGLAYVSSETHMCIEQGLVLCGFPKENVRKIAVDENFRIRTDLLVETIERDMAAGFYPFFLVGNAGTTNTGAVDDLVQAEKIARRYKMWFHVDAAYGGFFMLTIKGQELMKGIERADSLVLDPHKSLFLPYGTGALLVKDKTNLLKAFHFTGNYLPPTQEQGAGDPLLDDIMYLSQEVTRDFRGLRIWLPLKMIGIKPFREQLEEKLKFTQWMVEQLSQIPNIKIISQPQLSIVAFKLEPLKFHVSSRELDEINKMFLDSINRRGNILLSPFKVEDKAVGQFALRMAILSHRTTADHLNQGIRDIRDSVDECCHLLKKS